MRGTCGSPGKEAGKLSQPMTQSLARDLSSPEKPSQALEIPEWPTGTILSGAPCEPGQPSEMRPSKDLLVLTKERKPLPYQGL